MLSLCSNAWSGLRPATPNGSAAGSLIVDAHPPRCHAAGRHLVARRSFLLRAAPGGGSTRSPRPPRVSLRPWC